MDPIDEQRLDEHRLELRQEAVSAQTRRLLRHKVNQVHDAIKDTLIDYYEDMELNESLTRLHDVLSDWQRRGGGKGQARSK